MTQQPQQQRWAPDEQLVAAVRSGSVQQMSQLGRADRAWLVAGLTVAGWSAEHIAARCSCSLRLIRSIRADPMTSVCERLASEAEHFADELRLVTGEMSRLAVEHRALIVERARLQRLIARYTAAADGWPLCSKELHPMTPYNTYRNGARSWCRECHRERQARYRARARERVYVAGGY